MTVARLEAEMSHAELVEWMALATLDHREAERIRLEAEADAGMAAMRTRRFGRGAP